MVHDVGSPHSTLPKSLDTPSATRGVLRWSGVENLSAQASDAPTGADPPCRAPLVLHEVAGRPRRAPPVLRKVADQPPGAPAALHEVPDQPRGARAVLHTVADQARGAPAVLQVIEIT